MDTALFREAPNPEDLNFLKAEHEQSQRYVFKSGDWNFLVAEKQQAEVLLRPTLHFFPLAPKSLLGLCNIRGQAVPVFAPFSQHGDQKIKQILFFPEANDGFALQCDSVRLLYVPAQRQSLDPLHFAPDSLRQFISNIFFLKEEIYLVCDWPSWIESLL